MDLIGGKWKVRIICTLYFGKSMRYGELRRAVEGISPTMLANSLKELESAGLVSRTVAETSPVQVSYSLTEASMKLLPILDQLRRWMTAYQPTLFERAEGNAVKPNNDED